MDVARTETLDFAWEVKRAGAAGEVEGLASTWSRVPDSFGDTVARGAFARSLAEHQANGTLPAMLWSHDTSAPIGRWNEVRETAQGLHVRGRLTLAVQQAAEAHALLKDGALDGLSIGYRTRKSRKVGDGRELQDVQLFEISLVSMPANSGARVEAVRSALVAGSVPRAADLEAALRERLGLSQRQAKGLLARGLQGLSPRDEADVLEALDRLENAIRG